NKGIVEYRNVSYGKLDNIIGYAYSRLLISAMGDAYSTDTFVRAVAKRSVRAMMDDSPENVAKIASELGLKTESSDVGFYVKIADFLDYAPSSDDFSVANYAIEKGRAYLSISDMAMFLDGLLIRRITQGLPIPKSEIPKFVAIYAASMQGLKKQQRPQGGGTRGWIEKLLEHPIPDVRQRAVGLILAPYLVNVKRLEVNDAYKIIVDYINRCKTLESSTRITDSQIMYYCKYAKQKGTKPLSLSKAREIFAGVVDFDSL
ncbi:hypothetical protein B2A_14163, partial [mine drainage metagenome]